MQATKTLKRVLELDGAHWIATEDSILVPSVRMLAITLGIKLKSQGGASKTWKAQWGESRRVRLRVMHALARVDVEMVVRHLQGMPNTIRFVRLAPRSLDTDNLATAFKPVRDQVCAWLACDNTPTARANDSIRSGYTFAYGQQRQPLYGVRIEVSRA